MVMIQDNHHKPPTTRAVKLFGQEIGTVVAQPSTAVQNDVVHRYSNGLKQDGALAMAICCLKHTPLDKKTSIELERMKRLSIRGREITKPSRSRTGLSIPSLRIEPQEVLNLQVEVLDQLRSNYVPPIQMPAIPGLTESMIGDWSRPFVKQLTLSDVRDNQSRLSMNKADVEECIFPMLDRETEDPLSGIDVVTYDLFGNGFKMIFKIWGSGKIHVLTAGWKDFYRKHHLEKLQDFVTVWVFRRADTGQLCFLLTWRRIPGVGVQIKRKLLRGD